MFIYANETRNQQVHLNRLMNSLVNKGVYRFGLMDETGDYCVWFQKKALQLGLNVYFALPFDVLFEGDVHKRRGFMFCKDHVSLQEALKMKRIWQDDFIPLLRKSTYCTLLSRHVDFCFHLHEDRYYSYTQERIFSSPIIMYEDNNQKGRTRIKSTFFQKGVAIEELPSSIKNEWAGFAKPAHSYIS